MWQFPHFDAIAWLYREDYARGGIRMLPVIEPDGESTAKRVVLCSLLLIPISLLPRFLGMTGPVYAAAALAAGLGLLYFGARLSRERTLARAHALLLASVVYLPILLAAMVMDRHISWTDGQQHIEVLADPELLRLAMNQLIENACKYSQPGSTVKLDIVPGDDFVSVRVSNSGSTIPCGEQRHVFERFYRGAEARRDNRRPDVYSPIADQRQPVVDRGHDASRPRRAALA